MIDWKNAVRRSKAGRQLLRYLRALKYSHSPYAQGYSPGHYYSPIPDIAEILKREDSSFKQESKVFPGLELREAAQLELLNEIAAYHRDLPFPVEPGSPGRYYYQNDLFSYPDAVVCFGMLRHFRPGKVIEIGSGFSSALLLDTNDKFFDGKMHCTFIEPYPDRLNSLLSESDALNHRIIPSPIQEVGLELFDTLGADDILFVDSSHVVKTGSDVVRIVFEILPRLNPGVIVHFHDIYWPFEYPKDWLVAGRAWNETYFLRAFLQYNSAFEVMYYNAFMTEFHRDKLEEKMPLCLREGDFNLTHGASSLWLRKTPPA
jgi:Methyltransferase domain